MSFKVPLTPISRPAKASVGKTGLWRFLKPVIELKKCKKCGLCWMYCPDIAVTFDEMGFPHINYDFCKGCGICANECPTGAIKMVREGL